MKRPNRSTSAPRWLLPGLLCIATLVLLGLFSTELADPDAWWHLKTGEFIVRQHRLPSPDPFAFTTAAAQPGYAGEEQTRRFNLTHEWLAQAVWYLVESAAGPAGVVLWKAVILTALCGFTGLVVWRRTASWLWAIAAAMAAASLAVEFAHDRPSILSYLFTAVFVAILDRRRRLWLLPLLAVLWANCHGGFFLGWVVCGAYSADALLRRLPDRRTVLSASAAAILVSGLNPNGFLVLTTLLRYRSSELTSTLIEWSQPGIFGLDAFHALLYSAAAVLALGWRRVRVSDWLLFAAFAGASLMAFRNELLIGLLAPILIASYFPWQRPAPVLAKYAAGILLVCALAWGVARGSFFQLRAAGWRYPERAAAFLKSHPSTGRLFNTYEYGGYLIWSGLPVFIDGRALSETVFGDYRRILGAPPGDAGRHELLARYGIGAIVLNSFEYNSGVLYPLALDLANPAQTAWKLVYADPQALVFFRDLPMGVNALDKTRALDQFESECRLHVERDPEFPLCARTLGDLFLRSGNRAAALRSLSLYLQHADAEDTDARRAYAELLRQ